MSHSASTRRSRSKRTPPPWGIAHSWSARSGVSPCILHVTERREKQARVLNRIRVPHWVVDYEFRSYGLNRTTAPSCPWIARPPATCHLYSPRLEFWEDTRAERPGGDRHSAWIFFDASTEVGLDALLHPAHRFGRFVDSSGAIGELFGRVARVGQTLGDEGFWAAQGMLCELIDLLFRESKTGASPSGSTRHPGEIAPTVHRFLSAHLGEKLTVSEIARHLHVSPSSLAHRFAEETGETPMRALARLRVAQAKVLLLRGVSIKTVADALGFADPFHFSKTFKRVEGKSPSAFVGSA